MKYLFLIFVFLFLSPTMHIFPQCGNEKEMIKMCYPGLKDYKYIKSFPIILGEQKRKLDPYPIKWPLNKGTRYRIVGYNAAESKGKLIIKVWAEDFENKILMGSTFDEKTKKHYPAIEFECNKSGLYIFNFYFEDGLPGCAICLIGVKD